MLRPADVKRRIDMISLKEVVADRKCAVIVVDVQNDFCDPKGPFGQKGLDLTMIDRVLPRIENLVDAAHDAGVPVIYIKNTEDDSTDCEAWNARPDGSVDSPNEGVTRRGSWGAEIFKLEPCEKDIIIEKHRFNAFHNTRLETALKSFGIQTVVVCGFATNVCVYATSSAAVMYGYHVVVAEDAVGAWIEPLHQAALENLRLFIGKVVSSEEIIELWKEKGQQ